MYAPTYSIADDKSRYRVVSVGVWLVLWDDGSVEKIPYDEIVHRPQEDDSFTKVIPNEIGIGWNCVSHAEYWTNILGLSDPLLSKPLPQSGYEPLSDNGGPESLVSLSRMLNMPNRHGVERIGLWKNFDAAQADFTLSDIQVGATKLGLDTQVQKQSLPQLQVRGSTALLFLKDDGRIVTLTAIDDDHAVVIDRGLTRIVNRAVLEARYSGEALFPTKSLTQNTGITAADAVRSLQLPSLEAEVPQQFILRNTSTLPVTLQLESPLLGMTESKLSKDTLAPGETATLDLKVKWRSILKAPTQNVLVSLQTSDPIVPRLQLAILLTPPAAAAK